MWPTVRRLFALWREESRLVALGLGCACFYTGLSLAIPVLIQRIDDVDHVRPSPRICRTSAAILVLAIIRFGLNFCAATPPRIGIRSRRGCAS